MGLWKLRLSMVGTLALIIGVSTLFAALILRFIGALNMVTLAIIVILFNLLQWLFAPHIIEAIYRVKEASKTTYPELHQIVERLSKKSRIKRPKLMIADIPVPNAFAYGSPLTGSKVAVTKGLISELSYDEIEAVIGHELGHLRHRDVQVMMFVSLLPALFYLLAESLYYSAFFRTWGYRDRDESGGMAFLIAALAMMAYFILNLLVLGLSRLREYYADNHSASIVEDGANKLSIALAKIVSSTSKLRNVKGFTASSSFKTLFISDPDSAERDLAELRRTYYYSADEELVRRIASRRITLSERIMELFSTHPNITKRIRALQRLAGTL